jgi:hypothetical protein
MVLTYGPWQAYFVFRISTGLLTKQSAALYLQHGGDLNWPPAHNNWYMPAAALSAESAIFLAVFR